jgi:CHAD domain-containing protein
VETDAQIAPARGEADGLREEFARWALGLPGANAAITPLDVAARLILSRYLEEVKEHAPSLKGGGDEEEQHELRKSLRRVRYALETLSVCFDTPVKSHVKRLVEMQDLLGEMQDRAVLVEHTRHCFGKSLPEDVADFVDHGERRRRNRLGRVRAAWVKSQSDGFWDELNALV